MCSYSIYFAFLHFLQLNKKSDMLRGGKKNHLKNLLIVTLAFFSRKLSEFVVDQ